MTQLALKPDGSRYSQLELVDAGPKVFESILHSGTTPKLEDLAGYEVRWDAPLVAPLGEYELHSNPPPNNGGVAMIEAYNLALAAGMVGDGHWTESPEALRKAITPRSRMVVINTPSNPSGSVISRQDLDVLAEV